MHSLDNCDVNIELGLFYYLIIENYTCSSRLFEIRLQNEYNRNKQIYFPRLSKNPPTMTNATRHLRSIHFDSTLVPKNQKKKNQKKKNKTKNNKKKKRKKNKTLYVY